jgi:hypothetical protein
VSAIDFSPVANTQDEDANDVVLDVTYYAIISYSIFPEIFLGPMETTAEPAGILLGLNPFVEKLKNSLLNSPGQPG